MDILDLPTPSRRYTTHLFFGYLLLAASAAAFGAFDLTDIPRGSAFPLFIAHYLLALLYAGILIGNRSFGICRSWERKNIGNTMVLLNLFLISAYALNRELPVFHRSTDWLCAYLVVTSVAGLSLHYFESLPRWINRLQYLLLGSSLLLYGYLAVYTCEYYPVGTIGILFFGIGAHIFVPLTLLLGSAMILIYHRRSPRISQAWVGGGFLVTALICLLFTVEWTKRIEHIEKFSNQSVLYKQAELPLWARIGQSISNDWITKRMLKSGIVYDIRSSGNWEFFPQQVSWEEQAVHDPLVMIASLWTSTTIPAPDRVKILQSISDDRHKSNERLWSGNSLITSFIITDIDVFPDLRLAYTEKYLNIRSTRRTNWNGSEEAIYTFQLPEGSVVTSLSLWINGAEEKGILTSKQKATAAYKDIVGIQRRDPSVVHWQEGNTVTVRVFPCTPTEERKVKIGITSPLLLQGDEIRYQNIVFKGPNASAAKETIRVRLVNYPSANAIPGFRQDAQGDYLSEGPYNPNFAVSMKAVPFKTDNHFSYKSDVYHLAPYQAAYAAVNFTKVYLDINGSWTSADLQAFKVLLGSREVYIAPEETLLKLTSENWETAEHLLSRNFSLFPFHRIHDKEHSLVITKGRPLSPHLADIKDSDFATHVARELSTGSKLAVYNLDGGVSTFVASLREFRAIEFATGSADNALRLLNDHKFPTTVENATRVVLHDAGLVVTKETTGDTALVNNAPDHLARLFAYNDILRKTGRDYLLGTPEDQCIVDEATFAYVVSPVSSLIVLETPADYDKFNIKDNVDGLKNASKDSSGAVPEPHEWALIGLFVLAVIAVIWNRRQSLHADRVS